MTDNEGQESGEWVAVRPGLRFPRFISATEGTWGPDGYTAAIEAQWDPAALAYVVDTLEVKRSTRPITAVGLRRFSVQDLLRFVVTRTLNQSKPSESTDSAQALDEDRLTSVARVYAISRACNERPLKAVADTFGISQSYATRLVARARELEMLD